MIAEDFRGIFERFQNLNLLVLIEDIKNGNVARGTWSQYIYPDDATMCPLMHGFQNSCNNRFSPRLKEDNTSLEDWMAAKDALGMPYATEIMEFTAWWDSGGSKTNRLLKLLHSILQERMIDADAVQACIGQEVFAGSEQCPS